MAFASSTAAGLTGRSRDLAVLGELLDQAAEGGGALLLTGEPGIGKSVLLAAAAEVHIAE